MIIKPAQMSPLLAGVILLSSCSADQILCAIDYALCLDCHEYEPDYGILSIRLTINAQNPEVPIVLYQGDVERYNVLGVDTVSVERISYELEVDNIYTVTALYSRDQDTVLVIDSDWVSTYEVEDEDENEKCWKVEDGNVDVRLDLDHLP